MNKSHENKTKTVKLTTVFPAPKRRVFELLSQLKTLQKVAAPYIYFQPIGSDGDIKWQQGSTFVFRAKLFGFIPFGKHTIRVIDFGEDNIYTHESNTYVPVWNHRIILETIDENTTSYTDEVEIYAGWKTPFVYAWAKLFYAHRQKRWIKLLESNKL